ncbi:hypothetical protein L207DRAFT_518197 [Hyaloscypha variabilis F]|uniref:WW domain-containing protein n=1 Tax=Hyaloscypha variabilis (strain UAMH 11265 / GT02V1 / F) TaxID=1149755 RepID=A0A2J6R4I3_HYAVF|nr:hypothetical protein L207DRAFT_518197 [Hyaloscypha variabilis F]
MGGGEITPHEAAALAAKSSATNTSLPRISTQDASPNTTIHNTQETASPDHRGTTSKVRQSRKNKFIMPDGEPLPAGWEARCKVNNDGSEGRTYFVNHNKRETTWIDPRSGRWEKMEEDRREMGELPKGWAVSWKRDGRKYFIDHNERKTTWDDPRVVGERVAAE